MAYRVVLLFSFMLALGFFAAHAEEAAPAADPAAIAAARELMEVVGVDKQLDQLSAAMSKGFEKGASPANPEVGKKIGQEFNAFMERFKNYKEDMKTDMAVLYAQTFTAAEMKEVADFYRGKTGSRFIAAMPVLMQKGSEIGIKYAQKVMQEIGAPGAPRQSK